ncbi:pur operon repressor [Clostridium botulinum C]|uniref:Pur operon repressor n=4 Tax=Clostridium TaxID=1485 RepID=A0A9Q4XT08_CLOBO|nr:MULTISPECIES: pur operon repressor [Clostridium]EGO88800.2 LacI family transcriptional regulator [Clostridium botulinum C str. Stockholm]KEI09976.1 LacI family transcriptional regulator [Clostridium sp. K25]KEI12379.1 LacI family transcriptional regulator [Clostridium novyi B str. NCTC 9691]KEI15398.1 LacI family transcriptional regulator [Clostridium haemolyticum NCTC 9693]KEI17315.1 LacI family transcriptional regulator [Clostridium novyi B str. ATCC 27606]
MKKFNRNQRITAITKTLIENPNKIINLNKFTEMFGAAKSTISEDIVVIRETLNNLSMGNIETIAGAAGGIKYTYGISEEKINEFTEKLCMILQEKQRIVPGEFMYISDIMFSPEIIQVAAIILASHFKNLNIDCVVTVETKGIPLAYEVAKKLGVNLVIVRRDNKVTEGPTVSINYVSGSTKRIQTMSLSKKSINKGSKCIFIDDFMKAGGTALGIINILKEFESELVGIGVLVDNINTEKKLVKDYISIIKFGGIDENDNPIIYSDKIHKK